MDLRPKLIIIAGPNGSGKTSLTTQILKHLRIEFFLKILQNSQTKFIR